MKRSTRGPARVIWVACVCGLSASFATAAPVLRSANIHITMTSPTSCEVTMTLTVDSVAGRGGASASANAPADRLAPPTGTEDIEHRVEALSDNAVQLVGVEGARHIGELRTVGRTRSLVLQATDAPYTIRYRARQSDRPYRCPMWLPTTPTDGISRTVRLLVDVPSSATPGGSMPAMTWTGTRGTTTLGHVPAFVRVPFALDGDTPGWDVARVMDTAAVVAFAGASALWIWRRRR